MGAVLPFKSPTKPSPRVGRSKGGDAQIVFFPGVRVERHTVDLSRRVSDPAVHRSGNPNRRR